jgi:hypothetical protein
VSQAVYSTSIAPTSIQVDAVNVDIHALVADNDQNELANEIITCHGAVTQKVLTIVGVSINSFESKYTIHIFCISEALFTLIIAA